MEDAERRIKAQAVGGVGPDDHLDAIVGLLARACSAALVVMEQRRLGGILVAMEFDAQPPAARRTARATRGRALRAPRSVARAQRVRR